MDALGASLSALYHRLRPHPLPNILPTITESKETLRLQAEEYDGRENRRSNAMLALAGIAFSSLVASFVINTGAPNFSNVGFWFQGFAAAAAATAGGFIYGIRPVKRPDQPSLGTEAGLRGTDVVTVRWIAVMAVSNWDAECAAWDAQRVVCTSLWTASLLFAFASWLAAWIFTGPGRFDPLMWPHLRAF